MIMPGGKFDPKEILCNSAIKKQIIWGGPHGETPPPYRPIFPTSLHCSGATVRGTPAAALSQKIYFRAIGSVRTDVSSSFWHDLLDTLSTGTRARRASRQLATDRCHGSRDSSPHDALLAAPCHGRATGHRQSTDLHTGSVVR